MALAPSIELPGRPRGAAPTGAADLAGSLCPMERLSGRHVTVLHWKTRHSRACRMGHVVIGRSGVFVVGVAQSPRDPIGTQMVGGMLSPARTELLASGRVVNELIDAVAEHADEVDAVLHDEGHEDVVVRQLLWLPGGRLPLLRSRLLVDDVAVVAERRLRRTLARRGPLETPLRRRLENALTTSFAALG
jgi:hypothetical protein